MQNKAFKFGFFIGAPLIAGLIFFRLQNLETTSVEQLKPSQLDFSKGNQLPATTTTTVPIIAKVELKAESELDEVDQKKWSVFEEILNSKNDNDPRVDKELKNLSPQMHANLRNAYNHLPSENRNGRGFIAFLIARDFQNVQDVQFLKEIYQESPCLSFQDCEKVASPDPHLEAINETSLSYPQLAGLYQLQRRLENHPEILNSSEMKGVIQDLLREARQFPVSSVQKRAREIQEKFGL